MTALCARPAQDRIGGTVQECAPVAGIMAVLMVAALDLLPIIGEGT
jgi:hypothetical protein